MPLFKRARSTFYYQQKALHVADKYAALKTRIKTIGNVPLTVEGWDGGCNID